MIIIIIIRSFDYYAGICRPDFHLICEQRRALMLQIISIRATIPRRVCDWIGANDSCTFDLGFDPSPNESFFETGPRMISAFRVTAGPYWDQLIRFRRN
jgi:hypothetical protein